MQGACGGCPSARLTLKAGVETILRRYVPEVLGVAETAGEAVGPPAAGRLKTWLAGFGGRDGPPQRPRFTHGGKDMARRVAPGRSAGRARLGRGRKLGHGTDASEAARPRARSLLSALRFSTRSARV